MENTKIEWTTHSWNCWVGCTKVAPECSNCYAERDMDRRFHLTTWGEGQPRHRTGRSTWAQPYAWDRQSKASGACNDPFLRPRVFCLSLGDWADPEVPAEWRQEMWKVVRDCTNLDWLMLSKRPNLWTDFLPADFLDDPWPHVWLGTSVGHPDSLWRLDLLKRTPCRLRFLSVEPYLRSLACTLNDLTGLLDCPACGGWGRKDAVICTHCGCSGNGVDWVICGGESGAADQKVRPTRSFWVRQLRDACGDHDVPFFFKQWGDWWPVAQGAFLPTGESPVVDGKEKLLFTGTTGDEVFRRVGKKAAGRLLDGKLYDGVPRSPAVPDATPRPVAVHVDLPKRG